MTNAPRAHPTRLPSRLALLVAVLAVLALIGWSMGLPRLAQPIPDLPSLSVVSAYTLLLAAFSLLQMLHAPRLRPLGKVAAGLVLWVGLVTLAEHWVAQVPLGFDPHHLLATPFFHELTGHAIHPSPHTALGFCLLAGALLLADGRRAWHGLAAQGFAAALILEAITVTIGYLFEAHLFYRATPSLGVSPPAALSLLALAVGVLLGLPERGLMALLTAALPGSSMLRRLLPATLLLPPLAGWLVILGADIGWYDPRLVPALITVLLMAGGSFGLLAMGLRLNRKNLDLHRSQALLEKTFSATRTLTAYLDRDFNFLKVNEPYASADGRTAGEFVGKNHFALYPNAENEALFRQVATTGQPYIAYARPFEYPDHPERGTTY